IEAWRTMAISQCLLNDINQGKHYLNLILAKLRQQGKLREQALIWADLGSHIRRQRPQYNDIAQAYLRSSEIFAKAGDMVNELNFGMEAANYMMEDAQINEANQLLSKLSQKYADTVKVSPYRINRHLAQLAQLRGDLS